MLKRLQIIFPVLITTKNIVNIKFILNKINITLKINIIIHKYEADMAK